MEQQFQTSFIPQKLASTGSTSSFAAPKKIVNIFSIIASVVFVLILAACIGLYTYKKVLATQILQESKSLVVARASFDTNTVEKLVSVSAQINAVNKILKQHVAVSQLFGLLQTLTVQKVSFSNFTYSNKAGALAISMDGEAQDYASIAAQSNVFAENSFMQNVVFSDFDLGTNGNVTFKFNATIDPSLIAYEQLTDVNRTTASVAPAVATTTATTSAAR